MSVWADNTKDSGVINNKRTLSIVINVSFKSLQTSYSAGRDVYGNRDLRPYENGSRGIEQMVKAFDHSPRDVRSAYLERLADELKAEAMALRRL
ncbi:MAG: hypothetical protein LQ343_007204 [Gyalolechia ehrenbergii]|nr:MAG: hypothetical protein LQ343_007204 [Gyalolechia ehrenbergii]